MMIRAEWPGVVVDIFVTQSQEVEEDEPLMLMEGSDAEHTPFYVNAPESGKVKKIMIEEGDFADEDDELIEMTDVD